MDLLTPKAIDEGVQADIPEPTRDEKETLKIRPLERIKLHPKAPIEPQGKVGNFSRSWILQDGRIPPAKGSVMRASYQTPIKFKSFEGVRKRMLKDFFWEQILDEMLEDMTQGEPVSEYCSEYDVNYVKENFEPRNLEVTRDKTTHLKYPLYGTGSSPLTFYSETIKKTGPYEILEKFRRCQYFTRPMEERLDDGWVL